MGRRALPLLGLFLCAGCASVAVTRLAGDADYREGIRFYRPAPYLLVTERAAGERQAAIVWLPKKDEEYVVRVRPGLGSVEAKLALQDGWNLTEFGESRDPKTADLVGGALGVLKAAEGAVGPRTDALSPGLYALEFDPATGVVRLLRRIGVSAEGAR